VEWKPVMAGDDSDDMSSQRDTDWTMVQSDSAAVSYRRDTQPSK